VSIFGLEFRSVFSSGHTPGKSAAFQRGAKKPLSTPLQGGLRFLPVLYPLYPSPHLRLDDSASSRWPRVQRAYHVSQVVPINGLRAPLYTGGNCTCVGRPLKSPEPAPHPILGLEPLSRLSSARFTMRNAEASLTLPLPVIPRSRSTVRLGFSTPAVCLRPPRYQGRPRSAGTEGTTS
jgi:hypothetical protein